MCRRYSDEMKFQGTDETLDAFLARLEPGDRIALSYQTAEERQQACLAFSPAAVLRIEEPDIIVSGGRFSGQKQYYRVLPNGEAVEISVVEATRVLPEHSPSDSASVR